MEPGPSSPSGNREDTIKSGNTILLRVPNGGLKGVKIENDSTVALGRFGSFNANELIGQGFGTTYEMEGKRLLPLIPRTVQDLEDTDATNELINDGEFVQPLTVDEITVLKQSGAHASDIIQKQIEAHTSYSLKTEYSKEKYKKRKEAKYFKSVTTVEPTIFNVCDYWYSKDQSRVRDIRPDTLSQVLNLANIQPEGRYLAVDDASGIVVAGILDRMGGQGRLMTICDTESPPAYPAMVPMNFKPHVLDPVLCSLNWATAQEDHVPVTAPAEVSPEEVKSDRQKNRLHKRKAAIDALKRTREDLYAGQYDALVIASQYDPYSIVERLFPYLSGSASIVIHSPYIQVLTEIQSKMRSSTGFLFPSVSEPWLRRYQVLPGRTHPTMNTSGTGGYILHTTKVLDQPAPSVKPATVLSAEEPEQNDEQETGSHSPMLTDS